MATNDFLPFAGGTGANVLDQADYEALAALGPGFSYGILPSSNLNKVLRQASIMAAVLARWIADKSGDNVVDDGTTATIEASLTAALAALGLRDASTAQKGVVQLADSATLLAGTDGAKAATAAALLGGLLGAGGTEISDYVALPFRDKTTGVRRNLILQWGQLSTGSASSGTVTFPLAFPNNCFMAIPTDLAASATDTNTVKFNVATATNVAWYANGAALNNWGWIAFGY